MNRIDNILSGYCKKVHFTLYWFIPYTLYLIPMHKLLSESDKRIYALIRNRIIHGEDIPTLSEINTVTGKSSPRSAVLVLDRLEIAGLIKRKGRKIRLVSMGLEDNQSVSTVDIPLLGCVAAGIPIFAEENVEATIPVTTAIALPGSKYFLLRVVGDSMNLATVRGLKIEDKSIVLVRQQPTAENGEKVVALINDEATVKILEQKGNVVILRPKSSNKDHRPIILTDNCVIQGVVVAVLPSDII